jgi:hypothetical protein
MSGSAMNAGRGTAPATAVGHDGSATAAEPLRRAFLAQSGANGRFIPVLNAASRFRRRQVRLPAGQTMLADSLGQGRDDDKTIRGSSGEARLSI